MKFEGAFMWGVLEKDQILCSLHASRGEKAQTQPDEPHYRHSLWGDISAVVCARVLLFLLAEETVKFNMKNHARAHRDALLGNKCGMPSHL